MRELLPVNLQSVALCEVMVARAFEARATGDTERADALIGRARHRATRALIDVAD